MSSLSTTPHRFDQQPGYTPRTVLIATSIFLSGGFAGLFLSTVLFFSQVHNDLAAVHQDLTAQQTTIDKLTGKQGTASQTNSLLAELNRQERNIKDARSAVLSLHALDREVKRKTADIDYARQELEHVARLIEEVEAASDRLEQSHAIVEEFAILQSELAAQDSQLFYSLDAIDRVRDMNQRIYALSAEEDALHSSLTSFDMLAQRVQNVGERAEAFAYTMDDLDRLIERHEDLGAQLPGLEWDVDSMSNIVRQVSEQRGRIESANEVALEMTEVCDFINANDVAITNAMDTLEEMNGLESKVDEVSREIDTLVDAFHMVQGMNEAIQGVLMSSDRLRLGLAEMMLLEPAIERVVNDWTRIQSEIYSPNSGLSSQDFAKQIISNNAKSIAADEMEEVNTDSTRR